MLFTKPKKAVGIDIGSHSIKVVKVSRTGGRTLVEDAALAVIDRSLSTNDPIAAQAVAVEEALTELGRGHYLYVGALPGPTVVIRYPRLTNVGPERFHAAVQKEAGQNIPYDLSEVYLDYTLLDDAEEDGVRTQRVLLVAARHEVIDGRVQVAEAANLQFGVLSVDSLALADAAEACDFLRVGETVAMVNIGLSASSIHFLKDGKSNFIRDVNWGGRELIQAIAKDRRCDIVEAERVLMGANTERAEQAAAAAAAQQAPKEAAGPSDGGSLLDPLDEELGGGADPFGEALETEAEPAVVQGPATRSTEEVLSAGLARVVSEVRRSFDYYEHQLYERPVDRLILSGGVAPLEMLCETLEDELGIENVEVADPLNSALFLGDEAATAPLREQPAQFMVALGLAARGVAEL